MAEQTLPTQTTPTEVATTPTTRDESRYQIPPVDIYETSEGLTVLADLPGVEKDGVDVRVDNGILTIEGRASVKARGEALRLEYALVDYFRQFELSDKVDQAKIGAELKNGVLKILLPRLEAEKPRQIAVNVA